ncbi:MAG: diaminopimelate epimerase [Bacteroidetes bacterium]|nr:diaminopimelate epimerase [Bacteroidota bacterium]
MIRIHYTKMSGAGNTFIMADGRALPADLDLAAITSAICSEAHEHGGADGFMAIYPWSGGDFEMRYFNRDGSTGMMCGNGGRCAVRFAHSLGLVADPEAITFTNAGVRYTAALTDLGCRVDFPPPRGFRLGFTIDLLDARVVCNYADVGTPHAVLFIPQEGMTGVRHIADLDIAVWGHALRFHPQFGREGANANFVELRPDGAGILLRTFERGVEGETGACGTGAVSSAIIASLLHGLRPPVSVTVTSGATLRVGFRIDGDSVTGVSLEGGAEVVMEGTVLVDG